MSPAAAVTLPPGPEIGALAATLAWKRDAIGLMERCHHAHGDRFTLPLAPHGACVLLADPADARQVFAAPPAAAHAGFANTFFRPLAGERSILVLDEDEHLIARRRLLGAFHGERMRAYKAVIAELADAAIAELPVGEPIELLPRMQQLTLTILLRILIEAPGGGRHDVLADTLRELVQSANARGGVVAHAQVDQVLVAADELLFMEIARRRRRILPRGDVLSLLLAATDQARAPLPDRDIRDTLMTLLLAGYETSATTLAWAAERLARHPAALDRIAVEAGRGECTWTDAVVRETLRLRPVFPLVARRLRAPLALDERCTLPEDVTVAPCIWLINTKERTYPEPYAFRPERFLNRTPDTYAWLPFGGGVRRCLGVGFAQLEMRVILQALARRFVLEAPGGDDERPVTHTLTLVPGDGARVRLRRREGR